MKNASPEVRRGETLNESIDRVAANLTAVPHDPRFAARLNERLESGISTGLGITVSAAAAVVVVAAVVGLRVEREPATRISDAAPVAAVEQPWAADTAQAIIAPVRVSTQRGPRAARPSLLVASESPVPAIAGLVAPETLSVDELTLDVLTIAPVEFELLDLANLEVREIDTRGETKEKE